MEDTTDVKTKFSSNPGTVTVVPNGEKIPGGGVMTRDVAQKFFALKSDNLQKAFEDIKMRQFKPDIDGELLGRWVLTEISYWNRDKERIIFLGSRCILVCKYDFVAMQLGIVQRIELSNITDVHLGRFQYPANSILTPRSYEGLRISWGSMEEKSWFQKWNPLNTDIPFATFTSHPVFSLPDVESDNFYDVGAFHASLKQALESKPGVRFIENEPIVIETYAGVASLISNQSRLGFSRERGGVSF